MICIGKIIDAHGLKGEVKVRFISEEPEWLEDLFCVSIYPHETVGQEVDLDTYDVEEVRYTNQLWILKLSGLKERTQAEALKNHFVFVPEDFFKTSAQDTPYLLELKGFRVEVASQDCGEVIGFLETPAHSLILLKTQSGEYEIPWVPDFIQDIDRDQKVIKMKFPLDLLSEDFNTKK